MEQMELFLWASIVLMGLITSWVLLLTVIKRFIKIREEEKKETYQLELNEWISKLLYEVETDRLLLNKFEKKIKTESSLYSKMAIKQLKTLHQNFSGEMKERIQQLYVELGLMDYSLKKLNSKNWMRIVEGIRDLSQFRQKQHTSRIELLKVHPKLIVRHEVFLALFRLKGLAALELYIDSDLHLNDWVQSKVFDLIKTMQIQPNSSLETALRSKNISLLILIIRMIKYFGLVNLISVIEKHDTIKGSEPARLEKDAVIHYFKQLERTQNDGR